MRSLRSYPVVMASAMLASCISFPSPAYRCVRDEHHFRIDGEHDVVEWIEIDHGLFAPSEDVRERIAKLVAGARVFPPAGGFLVSTDLEAYAESDAAPEVRWIAELVPSVHVEEVSLVFDTEGRPSLWRKVRIERASQWLIGYQREASAGSLSTANPDLPPSVLSAFEAALADATLLRIEGDSFVEQLLTDPATAQLAIEQWRAGSVEASLRPRASIAFDGERLRARWSPDRTGWIGAHAYAGTLGAVAPVIDAQEPPDFQAIAKAGLRIEPEETYVRLRQDAGLD